MKTPFISATQMLRQSHLAWIPSIVLLFTTQLEAQVPDLTAGGTPTSTKNVNLGPTGMIGWHYHNDIDSSQSRQILIKSVDPNSPADGKLLAGDVILGADGSGANPAPFNSDARKAYAMAITEAEANNPAELKLLRWRNGSTSIMSLSLQHLGAYSSTAPYNCPKSQAILEQGLAYVEANQNAGRLSLGTLALLATNDPGIPNNAARQARARAEARSLILPQNQIDDMLNGEISNHTQIAWWRGHHLIVLCEYYLQTNDPDVLPTIEAMSVEISNGQSLMGTMGHGYTLWGENDEQIGHLGYGVINSANMPCFLALLLAKECGITRPELQPAIDRASRFYAAYSGLGTIPYGEGFPFQLTHELNGKNGLAAIAFGLTDNHNEERKFFSKMVTASSSERLLGHTGPFFNALWAPLGAAVGGEAASASHFSRISHELDLSRRWDGGFAYSCLGHGENGGKLSYKDDIHVYTAALLTYALPMRKLAITGRSHDLAKNLSTQEVSEAVFADQYDASSRTTTQLITDLGHWSPKVRYHASREIDRRPSEHASLTPQLIAIANDIAAGEQRLGACFALGQINSSESATALVNLLEDSDRKVRYFAAEALRNIPNTHRLPHLNQMLTAVANTGRASTFPLDQEDPMQLGHTQLCMLLFEGVIRNGDISGIDRGLLYPAIEAAANSSFGRARNSLKSIYSNLTQADVEALGGTIVDATLYQPPASHANHLRIEGMQTLQKYHIAEGVPIAGIVATDIGYQHSGIPSVSIEALNVLALYAGACNLVNPDPEIIELCEVLLGDSNLAADAQEVLDSIAADSNPLTPIPFKGIQSITIDDPSLQLPNKSTQLHVAAYDHAQGDTIYTWRKIHGGGHASFSPNGTGAAKDTNLILESIPGEYLFEVTMSDSRGLTNVVRTLPLIVYNENGQLPPNDPPNAISWTFNA